MVDLYCHVLEGNKDTVHDGSTVQLQALDLGSGARGPQAWAPSCRVWGTVSTLRCSDIVSFWVIRRWQSFPKIEFSNMLAPEGATSAVTEVSFEGR